MLAFSVAPFLPATNIFLYVGTYIGERLLYMPSLGYCLLLAEPLANIGGPVWGLELENGGATNAVTQRCRHSAAARILSVSLLLAFGTRTLLRNADWLSEETLFISAMRVCPDSAKVRLNNGILSRRSQDWPGALAHFRRAVEIEPGYCDPQYWIGLTLVRHSWHAVPVYGYLTHRAQVNQGHIRKGVTVLEKALDCKWVAVEAGRVLLKARSRTANTLREITD